ncbi:MAG: hybrid sensor histidine kinase/response regulator [Puniceicoccales bacterium]
MKLIDQHRPGGQPMLLAVDDQPENLRVLGNALSGMDMNMAFAMSGEEALAWLSKNLPDIILMDVSMPGIDGFECCRQLKTREELADVPVIFLTARVEVDDINAGFEAGAVDYITKPFNSSELIARVQTHLKIQDLSKVLHWHLELSNELIGIIAHDIRGPVASMRCIGELLMDSYPECSDAEMNADNQELIRAIIGSADRTINTLSELLNAKITHKGEFKVELKDFKLSDAYDAVRQRNVGQSLKKEIALCFEGDEIQVHADPWLLSEALDNLVSNAVKYSPSGKNVTVQAITDAAGVLQIIVQDEGPGFQAEDYSRLFQRYERLSASPTAGEPSFGLGLSLVKDLMTAQGGNVELLSQPGESARFALTLPKSDAQIEVA